MKKLIKTLLVAMYVLDPVLYFVGDPTCHTKWRIDSDGSDRKHTLWPTLVYRNDMFLLKRIFKKCIAKRWGGALLFIYFLVF